jgi:hypothetical protein
MLLNTNRTLSYVQLLKTPYHRMKLKKDRKICTSFPVRAFMGSMGKRKSAPRSRSSSHFSRKLPSTRQPALFRLYCMPSLCSSHDTLLNFHLLVQRV